jgi:hypothetical protein
VIHGLEWWQLCLFLVVGASLLEPKPLARAALAGLVPALLGSAALAVIPFDSSGYVSVSLGLVIAGTGLPLVPAARALRGPAPGSSRSIPGAVLLLVGAVALGLRLVPQLGSIGARTALVWAAAAPAAWWILVGLGRLVRVYQAMARLDCALLARQPPTTLGRVARVSRPAVTLLVLGAALVFLAPLVWLVVLGLILAAVGAEMIFRSGPRVPVLPVVTLALIPACWLVQTVAGPMTLRLATLTDVPMSPAAARLVALPLGLVAWAWMGLWPLHGVVRPVLLAPLGVATWLRMAEPMAREGLLHWQPVFVGLAVLGLWHAAGDGRLASVFVALGFSALASLAPMSAAAAALLLAAALAFKLAKPSRAPALLLFDGARRLGFVTSCVGAELAFIAGLGAEAVFTVLAAGGLAYGFRAASPLNDL